jgi:hypothetical protein
MEANSEWSTVAWLGTYGALVSAEAKRDGFHCPLCGHLLLEARTSRRAKGEEHTRLMRALDRSKIVRALQGIRRISWDLEEINPGNRGILAAHSVIQLLKSAAISEE